MTHCTGKFSAGSSIAAFLLAASLCLISSKATAQTNLSVRFLTLNVDFNISAKKTKADVQSVANSADIMMFQEAKNVTIDDYLGSDWTVYQVVDQGDAKRGSALAIRNSILITKLAQGLIKGVDAGTAAMLDRYIAWMDVELTNGRRLRIMSLHMPPGRFDYLQPPMADTLVTFANTSPYPVVVGADWNYTVNNDPYDIKGRIGLIPRGIGIDGFYRDSSVVKFTSITELTALNVNSDHDPVQMITGVTPLESGITDWMLYR